MSGKLFSPGPVMVEEPVRQALLHHDICHRSPEFETVYAAIRGKIVRLFEGDDTYTSVVVSASGTAANETCLSSIFRDGDEALLIDNGEFGHRLFEILSKYMVPTTHLQYEWATDPNLDEIDKALAENERIKWVCMVFHETSTAMINPVHEVGEIVKKYGRRYYVDCVSAAGGQHIDVIKNNIDLCSSVGGKCLGCYPGSAYVCGKIEIMEDLTPEMGKNVYLNLAKHYQKAKECNQTPNTPNVQLFWALDTALDWTLDRETLDGRIARYQECAKILRDGMRDMGLELLLPDEKMSNTVTSVFLPAGKKVADFINELEEDGYTVYAGKGKFLDRNMFQVANMGAIYPDDCREFLETLKKHI